ncbi:hypothetical protein MP228_011628 [Amoeboaphelidium protococcarum]|nr:hypothetical protein MP228_011628 [Amoeboaphelidium protococcarum]
MWKMSPSMADNPIQSSSSSSPQKMNFQPDKLSESKDQLLQQVEKLQKEQSQCLEELKKRDTPAPKAAPNAQSQILLKQLEQVQDSAQQDPIKLKAAELLRKRLEAISGGGVGSSKATSGSSNQVITVDKIAELKQILQSGFGITLPIQQNTSESGQQNSVDFLDRVRVAVSLKLQSVASIKNQLQDIDSQLVKLDKEMEQLDSGCQKVQKEKQSRLDDLNRARSDAIAKQNNEPQKTIEILSKPQADFDQPQSSSVDKSSSELDQKSDSSIVTSNQQINKDSAAKGSLQTASVSTEPNAKSNSQIDQDQSAVDIQGNKVQISQSQAAAALSQPAVNIQRNNQDFKSKSSLTQNSLQQLSAPPESKQTKVSEIAQQFQSTQLALVNVSKNQTPKVQNSVEKQPVKVGVASYDMIGRLNNSMKSLSMSDLYQKAESDLQKVGGSTELKEGDNIFDDQYAMPESPKVQSPVLEMSQASTYEQSAQDVKIAVYKVLYEFEKQQENDLCIKPMDFITVITGDNAQDFQNYIGKFIGSDEGWLYAYQTFGKQGFQFDCGYCPSSYCQKIWDSSDTGTKLVKYTALYDYEGRDGEELSFSAGDQFIELSKLSQDWAIGVVILSTDVNRCRVGQVGNIPYSYLKQQAVVPQIQINPFDDQGAAAAGLERVIGSPVSLPMDRTPVMSPVSSIQSDKLSALSGGGGASNNKKDIMKHRRNRSRTNPKFTDDSVQFTPGNRGTWSQSVPRGILDSVGEDERKRQEAIFELVQTEQTYYNSLSIVIDQYMEPLLSNRLLTPQDAHSIFMNIKTIYRLSEQVLRSLSEADSMSNYVVDGVGSVLLEYTKVADRLPGLRIDSSLESEQSLLCYIPYCQNQFTASQLLQKLRTQSPQLQQFLKTQMLKPGGKLLDLSSFLLEPMQRITRYPLLIKQILHYTRKGHEDQAQLIKALSQMEALLRVVNDATRSFDNRKKLEEVVGKIDLSPLKQQGQKLDLLSNTRHAGPRELLFQGQLEKAKSGRKLECFIFNDSLILCEPQGSNGEKFLLYRSPFALEKLLVKKVTANDYDVSGNPEHCIQLVNGDYSVFVKAKDVKSRNQWIKRLEDASISYLQSINQQKGAKDQRNVPVQCIGTVKLLVQDVGTLQLEPSLQKGELYCVAEIGSQTQRTRASAVVSSNSRRLGFAAKFNQSLLFSINSIDEQLHLHLYHYQRFSEDELISTTSMALDFLEYYCGKETEVVQLPLQSNTGTINVKMQYRPI